MLQEGLSRREASLGIMIALFAAWETCKDEVPLAVMVDVKVRQAEFTALPSFFSRRSLAFVDIRTSPAIFVTVSTPEGQTPIGAQIAAFK